MFMKETNVNKINLEDDLLEVIKEGDEILEKIKFGKRQGYSNIEDLIKSLESDE